jgi:hypothetical protein
MKISQRIILAIGVVIVALLILYPPWYYEYKYEPPRRAQGNDRRMHLSRPAGHHPIWDGTPNDQGLLVQLFNIEPEKSDLRFFTMRIDKDILTMEIIGVLIACGLLFLIARAGKSADKT